MQRSGDPLSDRVLCEISLAELNRNGSVWREVGGHEILAVATADGVRVYNGVCPHLGGPLAQSCVRDGRVRCPWHRYEFDASDGRCRTVPGHPWRNLPGRRETKPARLRLQPLRHEIVGDRVRVLQRGSE